MNDQSTDSLAEAMKMIEQKLVEIAEHRFGHITVNVEAAKGKLAITIAGAQHERLYIPDPNKVS